MILISPMSLQLRGQWTPSSSKVLPVLPPTEPLVEKPQTVFLETGIERNAVQFYTVTYICKWRPFMHHWNYYIPEEQYKLLREVSERAGMSAAEIVRRMTDHCLKCKALDSLVPQASGIITASGKTY